MVEDEDLESGIGNKPAREGRGCGVSGDVNVAGCFTTISFAFLPTCGCAAWRLNLKHSKHGTRNVRTRTVNTRSKNITYAHAQ